MTEEVPETYIRDPERSLVIAYASKEERCLLVASKLVDRVLEDIYNDDDNLASKATAAIDLTEIYKVYPEAFRRVPKFKKLKNAEDMLEAVPFIVKHNGLPLKTDPEYSHSKISIIELEMEAIQKERIAETLLDFPPSDDFLVDFGLERLRFEEDKVKVVCEIVTKFEFFRETAEEIRGQTFRFFDRYNNNKMTVSKLRSILNELESTAHDIKVNMKDNTFDSQVQEAQNDPSMTLEGLENLLREGKRRLVVGYMARSDINLETYEMIMSGKSAEYQSSKD